MHIGRPVRAFLHVNVHCGTATVAFLLRDRVNPLASAIYFGNQFCRGSWTDQPNRGFQWTFNYKNSLLGQQLWRAQAPVDFAWHHDAVTGVRPEVNHLSQGKGLWGKEMYNVEILLDLL